ncbi:hypothetical protein P7C70_g1601, partial [Phenoliferia sp. Uapishka_3]
MRLRLVSLSLILLHALPTLSAPYSTEWVQYNLNTNTNVNASVTDYSGSWAGHTYQASPTNWRSLPVYTIILDRWLDGAPDRNDVMGTMFEYDVHVRLSSETNGTKVLPGDLSTPNKVGCYDSEFDHYGDTEAFGSHPDYQRELSKFASVQDRLREWKPSVAAKLQVFGCLITEMLDIDGIRIDKATQMTVAALADWASTTRTCAAKLGKTNFFIPGEITGGNTFGSLYLGRGRTPEQVPNSTLAPTLKPTDSAYFLRDEGKQALDGAAFHYSIYRSLTRVLGMDGNISVAYDVAVDFVDAWNVMLTTNDFLNPSTGAFDPRHMFGVNNQDVFRWPSLTNGTRKNLFGTFITTLVLPGIPLTLYGEEQEMYIYDSQATNYLYGRQPMGSNIAWQKHGCYSLGDAQYNEMPFNRSYDGCKDDWNSRDHLDPTAPIRQVMTRMHSVRTIYPALLDGFSLSKLGNWTDDGFLPGSNGTATEFGVWSVERGPLGSQNFTGTQANTLVWLLYSNLNDSTTVTRDCTTADAILTPWVKDTVITNLFYPYDNITLAASPTSYYLNGLAPYRGCASSITLNPHGFAAYVPQANWVAAPPALTGFSPGHDARLLRPEVNATNIDLVFEYSTAMDCNSITNGLTITAETSNSTLTPSILAGSVTCGPATPVNASVLTGIAPTAWSWSGTVVNADDGIYMFTLSNVTSSSGVSTGTTDKLMVRKGAATNIMVFPASTVANYYNPLLSVDGAEYHLNHQALGASSFRWSSDYGQNWAPWAAWESRTTLNESSFNVTNDWDGKHVQVQYHSNLAASSAHVVEADAQWTGVGTRRIPAYLLRGKFNLWGYDKGLSDKFKRNEVGGWAINIMMSWPTYVHLQPIKGLTTYFFGDTDNDGVLDRLQPTSQAANYVNITAPVSPHLAYTLMIDEATMRWSVIPRGHTFVSILLFFFLALVPPITGLIAVTAYRQAFYTVTYNRVGVKAPRSLPSFFTALSGKSKGTGKSDLSANEFGVAEKNYGAADEVHEGAVWPDDPTARRKVLIATLEYELIGIQPPIKVKIGGLGVMSSLMGKAMTDVDIIWVVPKVKDIVYPPFTPTDPIYVKIFSEEYPINVEKYTVDNVTYYILDSPVFRAQTKSDPYPARMDDLESAIFYSTWNQSVAEVIRRTPNLAIYHAGAAYIAIHQASTGVAGVSDKYGKRSWARYPALWTLKKIDSLPNPDPTDIEALDLAPLDAKAVQVDAAAESKRPEYRRQAQNWAGLEEDPEAELFVFVGRWSKQKGIDLIADIFPSILEKNLKVQLICVGPVVDLYGRFAAEKLARLMQIFPGRVFSKPEFTALPPFLFQGAEFVSTCRALFLVRSSLNALLIRQALIPSRDEPFGLVAVEFGRKGALGVGSRLGGLGLAPGWWFNVESDSTVHMLSQFAKTIKAALKSTKKERAVLRARSAVQRFPVLEWRQRNEDLHKRSILASRKAAKSNAFNWDGILERNEPPTTYAYPPNATELPRSPSTPNFAEHSPSPSYNSWSQPNTPGTPADSPQALLHHPTRSRVVSSAERHPLQEGFTVNESDDGMDSATADYFGHVVDDYGSDAGDSAHGAETPRRLSRRESGDAPGSFLARANTRLERQMTKGGRGRRTRDPLFVHEEDPSDGSRSPGLYGPGPASPGLASPRAFGTNFANASVDSVNDDEPLTAPKRNFDASSRRQSSDSISAIMSEKSESPLNIALASFTDADGMVTRDFVAKMVDLDPSNSMKDDFCIEKYLIKQEKVFFDHVRKEKRDAAKAAFRGEGSVYNDEATGEYYGSDRPQSRSFPGQVVPAVTVTKGDGTAATSTYELHDGPRSGPAEQMATRLQIFMLKDIYGWPIYTIILALGQTLGASSFQLVLIGGSSTQSNTDLYIIGCVYLFATLCWYALYTIKPLRYTLSLPFVGYAIAFLLVGLPSATTSLHPWHIRHSITMTATCIYAFASAAGWAFFSYAPCRFLLVEQGANGLTADTTLEKREECRRPRGSSERALFKDRNRYVSIPAASIARLTHLHQKIWLAALWFWGFKLSGTNPESHVPSPFILCATIPLCVMALILAYITHRGLPGFYRQVPGHISNFAATLTRRKLVLWFLFSQILSIYWLSGPYGRNWQFLWQTNQIHTWVVVLLAALFFIMYVRRVLFSSSSLTSTDTSIWGVCLTFLSYKSREHTWYLPIFAVGLGAPRWCQMLWGTSGVGVYLPWAGSAGPYLSICLWLWLGVLDSIQGVGLGMMLLQTLSRVHVGAALALAQVIGSVVTIVARATSPDNLGPGSGENNAPDSLFCCTGTDGPSSPVFPNFGLWNPSDAISDSPFAHWAFWFAMICQLVIVFGYLVLFRSEQLSKYVGLTPLEDASVLINSLHFSRP